MFDFKYRSLVATLILCAPLMGCGEAVESDQQNVYFNEVTPDSYQEDTKTSAERFNKLLNASSWVSKEYPNPTIAGHYLAGRFAAARDDLDVADREMFKALELDPTNPYLIERAFPSSLGAGNITHALTLASKTQAANPIIAHLGSSLLIADAFKRQDYDAATVGLEQLQTGSFGHYIKPITQAWIAAATGKTQDGVKILNEQASEFPSLKALYLMHVAMIYEFAEDNEKASKFYEESLDQHFSARTAWFAGRFYERTGKMDEARAVYTALQDNYPQTTFTALALSRLKRGDKREVISKVTPKDGVMSGLFDLASILHQERSSRLAMLYGQVANYLAPEDPFLKLLMGDIQLETRDLDAALNSYASIKPMSDFYAMSQSQLAKVYEEKGKLDKAISILEKLSKNDEVSENVLMSLGDLLRRNDQFERAIPYYTKVIDGLEGKYTAVNWELFYARGVAYEQAKQWPKAEADLKKALEIEPEQPYVLNYLGYSWADQGMHIDLALEYIKKAVEARPNDGYIVDSMGWVLYKQDRFDEAVVFLEEAVAQVPGDPIINDHLGDAYWRVGRRLEAGFQWQRALDNSKDPKLSAEIELKILQGLTSSTAFTQGKPMASTETPDQIHGKADY